MKINPLLALAAAGIAYWLYKKSRLETSRQVHHLDLVTQADVAGVRG